MVDMKIAQQIVQALLEGDEKKSMPPWLQKKISGKKDGDDSEGDDKPAGEKKDKDDASPSVGAVTGSKKEKDGDKVEHTF